jgi:hypothetical protein
MKNCLPADMLELPQQCPFRVAVHQDVLTGLTREIGIHKDHFPFAKEGLHGVVFDRHGKRAFSRNVCLEHRFRMDDTGWFMFRQHLIDLMAIQERYFPHWTDCTPMSALS